jgi:hypothetical protein
MLQQGGQHATNTGGVTMSAAEPGWRKGRGKLGVLDPLLGDWQADADSPQGPVRCTRSFGRVLAGKYVQLSARWELPGQVYEELALFGVDEAGGVAFWSFTSDGKRSHGALAAAPEVHAQAVAFEAQMPAGLARQIYWPAGEGGFWWAVESRTKAGWNRFVLHRYRALVNPSVGVTG